MTAHTCGSDPAKAPAQRVQDGWDEHWEFTRLPRIVKIQPEWNAERAAQCQYTRRSIDKDCEHCERRH